MARTHGTIQIKYVIKYLNQMCHNIFRLATEMEDRRSLQQLLPEYFDFLKASAIRNDEMLRSVREKVEKLDQEKTAVRFSFKRS